MILNFFHSLGHPFVQCPILTTRYFSPKSSQYNFSGPEKNIHYVTIKLNLALLAIITLTNIKDYCQTLNVHLVTTKLNIYILEHKCTCKFERLARKVDKKTLEKIKKLVFFRRNKWKQDQKSQKLTTREPKGNKTRGIKVNTRTQKFKSQHVDLANQSISQKDWKTY